MANPRHRRSPRNLTIDDVYPDWITDGGIFGDFTNMPWDDVVNAVDIGIMYGAHSAERFIAPLVYNFLDDGEFETGARTRLASAVGTRFLQKWSHLWSLYTVEYNPLETYNLQESGERDESDIGTNTLTHGHVLTNSGTDTVTSQHGHVVTNSGSDEETFAHGHVVTDSGSDTTDTDYGKVTTEAGEPSSTLTSQRQGFNSVDFQNVTKDTTENVTDNTETQSGTDTVETTYGKVETNSGSDTDTTEFGKVETHSGSDVDSTLHGKVETHSGNDVTQDASTHHEGYSATKTGLMYRAPGELLALDREFWLQDFFSIVFEDIDSVLTLAVYAEKQINDKVY